MGSILNLVIDRQNKTLVSYQGSLSSLPALFQSNSPTLRVYFVDPSGNLASPFTLVDLSAYGLRVSIGATPTGTSGGPTPLTLQDTFSWNAAGKYFTADLNLAVVAIDTFIGTAASNSAFFEVNLTLAGNRDTILQIPCTLKAVVDELTSTSPTPTDQYMTKAESVATFQKKVGDLGQRLVLRSPSGVYGVELGCDDDGSFIANVITL